MSVSDSESRCYTIFSLARFTGIMLSRFKLDLPSIRKAILDVDDNQLSVDSLKLIKRQLPSSEEMARLKGFSDVTRLPKAEQFFLQASSSAYSLQSLY
jgi:diaphanous 1